MLLPHFSAIFFFGFKDQFAPFLSFSSPAPPALACPASPSASSCAPTHTHPSSRRFFSNFSLFFSTCDNPRPANAHTHAHTHTQAHTRAREHTDMLTHKASRARGHSRSELKHVIALTKPLQSPSPLAIEGALMRLPRIKACHSPT